MPANHPKTDLRTGLDWWTSHLQSETRAYDFEEELYDNYYEDYAQPQRPTATRARPARKPSDELIPGTDAWIEAQAVQKAIKKEPKKRTRKRKGKAEQTRSKSPEASMLAQADEPREESKVADEKSWSIFCSKHNTITLQPPKAVSIRSWVDVFNWLPKETLFSEAVEARIYCVLGRLDVEITTAMAEPEFTQALAVKLPKAQYDLMKMFIDDLNRNHHA